MINEIKNRYQDKLFIVFSIICLIMFICPFFSLLKSDGQSLNYIYNDGQVADGVLVIILVAAIYLLNLFNLSKSSLIPLSLLTLLLGFLFYNLCNEELIKYATFNLYLMYVCLVAIFVFNILFIVKKNR